jgi:Flp pilus assembly protein TadG
MTHHTLKNRLRSERGAEVVEFALVLPMLLLLGLGICDFGMLFQRYEVVTNAAREGARAGAVGLTAAQVTAVVQTYLNAGGLTATPTIQVTETTIGANPSLNAVRVSVAYPNGSFIVGPLVQMLGSSLQVVTLTSAATMRVEIQGS